MGKRYGSSSSNGGLSLWLAIALVVLLIDQITKILVVKTLTLHSLVPVTSFFNLVLAYNRGAAFSFLAAEVGWQRYFFTAVGLIATAVIVWLLKRHADKRQFCWALSLILGGALGNVLDRITRGHVVDFLDFHVKSWHWPAFNMADSAICIGAVLFILDELRRVNK